MRVNFLIAGTQKGGTTALAQFLSQHPQVCMAERKEVHFFDEDRKYVGPDGLPNIERYHSFFKNCANQPAIGEATPIYMYLPFIAERMHLYNPDFKLILVLRDPAQRAYSQYQMEHERAFEKLPFTMALRLERQRLKDRDLSDEHSHLRCHSYLDRGFYAKQIKNLLRYFPREHILLLRNEELSKEYASTMSRVYEFLGVAAIQPPAPKRIFEQSYAPMSIRTRAWLIKRFSSDIRELEEITGWDLTAWKNPAG